MFHSIGSGRRRLVGAALFVFLGVSSAGLSKPPPETEVRDRFAIPLPPAATTA